MITRALATALFLSLVSCTSAFVPFAYLGDLPVLQAGRNSDLDSVIYQGEAAEKAKRGTQDRSSILLLIGKRSFDEVTWEPVEGQGLLGIEWNWIPAQSIVGIEVGVAGSYNQQDTIVGSTPTTASGSTFEVYVGPRFEAALGKGPLRVYAGLGPSLVNADFSAEQFGVEISESDSSLGFYTHAGFLLELGQAYLGLDFRTLTGTNITLFGLQADADYIQVALAIGLRF